MDTYLSSSTPATRRLLGVSWCFSNRRTWLKFDMKAQLKHKSCRNMMEHVNAMTYSYIVRMVIILNFESFISHLHKWFAQPLRWTPWEVGRSPSLRSWQTATGKHMEFGNSSPVVSRSFYASFIAVASCSCFLVRTCYTFDTLLYPIFLQSWETMAND